MDAGVELYLADHELLTVAEAAKLLRVSRTTIYREITRGAELGLGSIRVGNAIRIHRDHIGEYFRPTPRGHA